MAGLSEYGRAIWDGTAGIAQHEQARSLFTDEKKTAATVGCVILPDAMNSAGEASQTGMIVDIGHDAENGEAVYEVLRVREVGGYYTARTFKMYASAVGPGCLVADAARNRHTYAIAALRAASEGSRLNSNDLRLVGIAVALVRECVA